MAIQNQSSKHSGLQLSGFVLWRFGLALAASVGIYRAWRLVFQFVDLPVQLEIGIGMMMTGALFFFASLVLERVQAMKSEGDLREDSL